MRMTAGGCVALSSIPDNIKLEISSLIRHNMTSIHCRTKFITRNEKVQKDLTGVGRGRGRWETMRHRWNVSGATRCCFSPVPHFWGDRAEFRLIRVSFIVSYTWGDEKQWTPHRSFRSAIPWLQGNQTCLKSWSPLVGLLLNRCHEPTSVNLSHALAVSSAS